MSESQTKERRPVEAFVTAGRVLDDRKSASAEVALRSGLAPVDVEGDPLALFPSWKVDLVKRTIARDATDDELVLFLAQASRTGLDPLSRQIRFWKDKSGRPVFHVGIDGLILIAQRTGKYRGYTTEHIFRDEETPEGTRRVLIAVRASVFHADFPDRPTVAIAYWDEYAPKPVLPGSSWDRQPSVMLEKDALALALRRTFPQDLSGLFEPAETEGDR